MSSLPKKISFHNHEIVGASIARNIMKKMGYTQRDIDYVAKLVRHHQFRFYDDTSDAAIIRWLQDLGPKAAEDIFTVRLYDRLANPNNKDKPAIPFETQKLKERINELSKKILFFEELAIDTVDLELEGIPPHYHKKILRHLVQLARQKAGRNNSEYLLEQAVKQYRGICDATNPDGITPKDCNSTSSASKDSDS